MSDKLADSSPFPFNGPSPRRSGQSDNEFENGFGHPDGESAAVRIRKSVSPTQFLAHAGTQKSSGVLSLAILPLSLAALLSSHPGSAAAAESKKAKAEEDLFTKDQVLKLQIKISEEGMAKLRQYEWSREAKPTDRIHVPATVREGAAVYTNVAIHVKGAAGSFRPLDDKPGFTLNFDKMAKGQRFHGLEKLSLNNSVQDPTFTTDKLCREVFVKAGVPVPRAEYATVELNGRSLGLYVLTEGWNKQFLKRYFKNVSGNLYDCGFAQDITGRLVVNSGQSPADSSDLQLLRAAAREPDLAKRLGRLEQTLDLDRFITFIALDAALWNWDGYALNRNNYRLFHDLDSGRFVFFPHGMDQMFWKPEGPIMPGMKGLVANSVLQIPECRRRYVERISQLLTNACRFDALTNRVEQLAVMLRPLLAQRTSFGETMRRMFQSDPVDDLKLRITQRGRSLDEQLHGIQTLLAFDSSGGALLRGWKSRTNSGRLTFNELQSQPASLQISLNQNRSAGAWWTTVWLEEGHYQINGRVRVQGVTADARMSRSGAGFRAFSRRKLSNGPNWDWFPYRESRDFERRGELGGSTAPGPPNKRLSGTTSWVNLSYEFELRQPMADLEISCELRGDQGEAWFDLDSLQIVRKSF